MRKEKIVKISDRKIKVSEFSIADIIFFYENEENFQIIAKFIVGDFSSINILFEKSLDIPVDDVLKFGADDLMILVTALKEVNSNFFAMLEEKVIRIPPSTETKK